MSCAAARLVLLDRRGRAAQEDGKARGGAMAGSDDIAAPAPRIGLALGAGGARGWCHIGAIRALEAMGLRPDVVAGCSMGALVGAAHAGGKLDALEDWALSLTARGVLRYLDMRLFRGGLVEGQEVARLMADIGLPQRVGALDRPFAAVATDLATGEELWLREGDLTAAVRASLSIPGVFNPYPYGERWLLDGALCNPVPVALARAMGADVVIAIDPNATAGRPLWSPSAPEEPSQTLLSRVAQFEMLPRMLRGFLNAQLAETPPAEAAAEPRPPNYFTVVGVAIDIMQLAILRHRLAEDPPEALLEADLKHMGILELNRAAEAIAHGRAMVEARAGALRALAAAPAG